jgi:hypothetical protein
MASDIVQAINRIRCRRVIDTKGNCPPAEVFILLPSDASEAQTILDSIKNLMPGVVIKPWDFKFQKRKKKKSNKEAVLVTYLQNMKSGKKEPRDSVQDATGISPKTMVRILGKVRKEGTHLNDKFKSMGVAVHTIREGRSFEMHIPMQSGH